MFFTATITFLLGCLGCGLAPNILFLNLMRGLTGLGGGGLITMATIINSDIIPLQRRGMYQAVQNGLHGFGAICGASMGGFIADTIGWRWCFLCQVPVSFAGLVIAYFVIKNPPPSETGVGDEDADLDTRGRFRALWRKIDLSGAVLLVVGLSVQLAALSLGGNEYPWSDIRVIVCLVTSGIVLVLFVWVEMRTKALPVMPMSMLKGRASISNMISNVLVGMSSYAVRLHTPRSLILDADDRKVPIYDPALLPSRTPRLGFESWNSTSHPFSVNPSWWSHCRLHHVTMGNAWPSRPFWMFSYDARKRSGCISAIPRFYLEIHRISVPSKSRTGNRVSEYFIHKYCLF
jgi:MFS family permease